jgi:glycyl-tRNA synthetase
VLSYYYDMKNTDIKNTEQNINLENLSAFLKSRGFVFPSSTIYGGLAGVYDYGHYGFLLMQNIKNAWMKSMIQMRQDVIALDSAIFMHPTTWKASGHVDTFNDPQIDCRKCKARFRADHILEAFNINADKASLEFINQELDKLRAQKKLVCNNCGSADLTQAKVFSLMVKSNLGSPTDALSEENVIYLRPETCGGIYLQYKNSIDSMHKKLPFGIAQIGKAFRNEITAKQFVFRTREFEQMEMQYFHHPSETENIFENWHKNRFDFYLDYGIKSDQLNWHKHDKLAHYASQAYDIEYYYKCLGGFKELEGVHARGDFDLTQHAKFSGADLSYFDESRKERFVPHIVETSVGLARMMLAFLDSAYNIEAVKDDKENKQEEFKNEENQEIKKDNTRIVLKLDKRLSPIKIAILPLSKKEELTNTASVLFANLSKKYMCEYDVNGSIGKRYRRQDEIGTPYCITIDFDTVQSDSDKFETVTVRHRDTMQQERVKISDLYSFLKFD